MKTTFLNYLLAFALLFGTFSCSKDDDSLPEEGDNKELVNEISVADEILKLVNEYRDSKGLSAITTNETANQLAVDHSKYMIAKGNINHDNFDQKFKTLREKENATSIAENVASSYPDAKSVMEGWINSKGHRDNLEGNFTHIGIAAVKNENGRYYYTQIFYR